MKAVMYHYVRERDDALPNFRFLNLANFRRQLDHFAAAHGCVTREEWRAYVTEGRMPATPGKVVLTFDDAMSCHFTHVFPELAARGLWGIFYVPTAPYTRGRVLDVHRLHLLCGAFDGRDLLARAQALVSESMIPHARRAEFHERTYRAQVNAEGVSELKRLLNYFLDEAHRPAVLAQLAGEVGLRFDAARFDVAPSDLRRMAQAGMLIGAHSVTHPVMSKLGPAQQAAEVADSLDWVRATVGAQDLLTWCHPYGGFHSFDADTVRLLHDRRVDFAFNVEPRDIEAADIAQTPMALPRHDCNAFVHGAAD